MDLKDREWSEFVLEEIFKINSTSSGIDKNKLNNKTGNIPYITRSEKVNGYDSFVSEQDTKYSLDNANVISIGLDTQTVFYQPEEFYTGQNLQILSSPFLNSYNSSFIISLLKIQMTKFNWGGNGATLTRLKRSKMLLPTTKNGKPDYAFMEQYVQHQEKNKLENYVKYLEKHIFEWIEKKLVPFKEKKWAEFEIKEIAEIVSGKDIYESERIKGDIPYITATASNNGIGYLVGNKNETLEANCLSVNRNGSVGYSFYHNYAALFSNDCRKLRLKYDSKYVGFFVAQQITNQRAKYGYGYKMGTARLKRQKIMLPVNSKSQPDYDYMEAYMRNIEREKIESYKKHIATRISELEAKFLGGG